jgi:2-oxoglutarate ferredoxin oxidoreductase subunit alpha
MSDRVLEGQHPMAGEAACAEGAIAAGCQFFAGYPSSQPIMVADRMARRLPETGGLYVQMEDPAGALSAAIGASWTGAKVMTATSGSGIGIMQEEISYAVATETPCVIVDVQQEGRRAGALEDLIQSRCGPHGPHEIVVFAPSSSQEMFDLTVCAFSAAEKFRTPVLIVADAFVGHRAERVETPREEDVPFVCRRIAVADEEETVVEGFLKDWIAPMPLVGRGLKTHVTASCHDASGRRNLLDAGALDRFVRTLCGKLQRYRGDLTLSEAEGPEEARVALVGYGSVGRVACEVARRAYEEGLPVEAFRMATLWPFPEAEIADLAGRVDTILVLEDNLGQMVHYIRAAAQGKAEVVFVPPEAIGTLHQPAYVLGKIQEVLP